MDKKNIGPVVGLYPSPITIVGTEVDGRVNWLNICHVGTIGMDSMLLNINKGHFSNKGIQQNKTVSVNLVTKDILVEADYIGLFSGHKTDKSNVFEYYYGTLQGAPLIKKSPISMECEVIDNYETELHDNFIIRVVNTYVDSNILTTEGNINFEKAEVILFERPQALYMTSGKVIAEGWSLGANYNK